MHPFHTRRNIQEIVILHTADLHLTGSREHASVQAAWAADSPFCALQAIVDTANRLEVDIVLMSGDLFDAYHPSRWVVSYALEQFSRLRSPAIIIPGNHDCLGESETYRMAEWAGRDMHPYVITDPHGEAVEVPGLPLVVWGRAMLEHTADFLPLEGLPPRNGHAWHVAMGHGFHYEDGETGNRASPIFASQIRESAWDYIALGHKHLHADVSQGRVKAAYSGAPVASWSSQAQVLLVKLNRGQGEPISVCSLPLFPKSS